jgi:hypothetical protein
LAEGIALVVSAQARAPPCRPPREVIMMATTKPEATLDRVWLYESHGEISCSIQAEINGDGDLLMRGQDVGQFPTESHNIEEYEFRVTVPAKAKDQLLLILLQRLYKGNSAAVEQFCDFLKAHDIPFEFKSWL